MLGSGCELMDLLLISVSLAAGTVRGLPTSRSDQRIVREVCMGARRNLFQVRRCQVGQCRRICAGGSRKGLDSPIDCTQVSLAGPHLRTVLSGEIDGDRYGYEDADDKNNHH